MKTLHMRIIEARIYRYLDGWRLETTLLIAGRLLVIRRDFGTGQEAADGLAEVAAHGYWKVTGQALPSDEE